MSRFVLVPLFLGFNSHLAHCAAAQRPYLRRLEEQEAEFSDLQGPMCSDDKCVTGQGSHGDLAQGSRARDFSTNVPDFLANPRRSLVFG
ncbi:hypothetical protein F4825DRAFT_451770 [Nemania diffusa]|nr:hypothetical protein F4825DRAFT_451770 [Nemania diffusa]